MRKFLSIHALVVRFLPFVVLYGLIGYILWDLGGIGLTIFMGFVVFGLVLRYLVGRDEETDWEG